MRGDVVQIVTNNYCNIHCEWCSFLCDHPIRSDSEWLSRRERWEITAEEVELFCTRFEGYYVDSTHKLLGGETTAIPPKKLYAIIDGFQRYDRKLKLVTNGFNIHGLDKAYLNKIGKIELNDHGVNRTHIKDCYNYLKGFYRGDIRRRSQLVHYDLDYARLKTTSGGEMCDSIMNPPTLYQGVVYPCCVLPAVELWNNNWKMREALTDAGWSLQNPSVCEVMVNWETTLPDYVKDQCRNYCWKPRNPAIGHKKTITLKQNDMIRKLS